MKSLNSLKPIRQVLLDARRNWLRIFCGVDIDPSASISLSARFVSGERNSISVGESSLIAFKTLVISRGLAGKVEPVVIGKNCFIGGGAILLPGVTVGDNSIVGAGAVVFDSIPPFSIVGGNPAKVLKQDADIGPYGRLAIANSNQSKYWQTT